MFGGKKDKKFDLKDAPRKRCQGCLVEYYEIELARFGRHQGSPYLCKTCAQGEIDRMKRNLRNDRLGLGIVEPKRRL